MSVMVSFLFWLAMIESKFDAIALQELRTYVLHNRDDDAIQK